MITVQKLAELREYCDAIKQLARQTGLRPDDVKYLSVKRKTDLIEQLIDFANASISTYIHDQENACGEWANVILRFIAEEDLEPNEDTGV